MMRPVSRRSRASLSPTWWIGRPRRWPATSRCAPRCSQSSRRRGQGESHKVASPAPPAWPGLPVAIVTWEQNRASGTDAQCARCAGGSLQPCDWPGPSVFRSIPAEKALPSRRTAPGPAGGNFCSAASNSSISAMAKGVALSRTVEGDTAKRSYRPSVSVVGMAGKSLTAGRIASQPLSHRPAAFLLESRILHPAPVG